MTRVIAIDWSGDAKHASEKTWAAIVEGGQLVELRNGRNATEIISFLKEQAGADPDLFVGFDFAFSFPTWFAAPYGEIMQLWREVSQASFIDWRREQAPFFGTTNSAYSGDGHMLRLTDQAMKSKSIFKVSGVGSVGTGSIRGMPVLAALHDEGFSVWPFMKARSPVVLEIYPRACLDDDRLREIGGHLFKTNPVHRRQYLGDRLAGVWLDLAASSEDSFDATISALSMWAHLSDLQSLPAIEDETLRAEGIIWSPAWRTLHRDWL